jgi:hypothetical protein
MLLYLVIALQIGCAGAAVILTLRRDDHFPFAAWSVGSTMASLARLILLATVLPVRPLGSPPFTGAERVAFHVDEALFLSSTAGLAAMVIVLFGRRRWLALLPGLAWGVAVSYLATHYPEVRGETLRRVYLGAELAALAISAASIVTWGWRREWPTPPRACAITVCLVDAGLLVAGAQRWGFWSRWDLQQYAILVLYLALTTYQVTSWRSLSPSQ